MLLPQYSPELSFGEHALALPLCVKKCASQIPPSDAWPALGGSTQVLFALQNKVELQRLGRPAQLSPVFPATQRPSRHTESAQVAGRVVPVGSHVSPTWGNTRHTPPSQNPPRQTSDSVQADPGSIAAVHVPALQ